MSMNITVMAKKGGVGKSTVALLLYEAFRQAGKTVALHDWDAQGTCTKALEMINGHHMAADRNADIVIWDAPPNLEHTATATAVRNADIVLVVTSPSTADIWEAEDAVQFAKARNPKAKIRVAFNKFKRATLLGRLVEESAKQINAPTLSVMLSERECYKHTIGQGWKSLDSAAREEVLQFAVALLSLGA
jgi:chromosome partitioning protein